MVDKRPFKPIKVLFSNGNYKFYLNLIKKANLPYKLTRTNYTLDIESEFCNIYFMTNVMSDKAFKCGACIKKDIRLSGMELPVIERSELKYFNFNHADILSRTNGKEIYNIDIKSAYANALNNNKLLSEKTYNFLKSLSKKDRLAAVGMLAARKDIFTFDNTDKCIEHEKKVKDTENWFYFCVLEIQKLMLDIKQMIGNDFLFYWVDGIFFTNENNRFEIEAYLSSKGYMNSYDKCTDFNYTETENNKFLTYNKPDGKGGTENKRLELPKENKAVNEYLLKLLNIIK